MIMDVEKADWIIVDIKKLDRYMVINDAAWERAIHCYVFRNRVESTCCVIVDAYKNRSENIKY